MLRRRQMIAATGALTLIALAVRHPTADIQLLTHDAADPAPHRMQAAVDLGLVGVKVLVTWTAHQLR